MDKEANRKQWIDFLRGIAMLLVIWEHLAVDWTFEFVITGPIKMPLFFAISGYLFNDCDGNIRLFTKKLFFSIILPWFLLSLVWLKPIFALISGHPNKILGYFYSFLSGKTLWFFPCLIIAELIFFCIKKCIHSTRVQYIVMILVSVAGLLINGGGNLRFALWDNAMVVQVFLLFGYWFRNNQEIIQKYVSDRGGGGRKVPLMLIFVYAILILVTCYFYPGEYISVHHVQYYNIIICGVMIFTALLFLFVYVPKIKRYPRWIIFVGRNTLLFYIGHYWPRMVFSYAKRYFTLPDNIVGYVIKFVVICIVMSALAVLFNRFIPFAVGKRSKLAVKY